MARVSGAPPALFSTVSPASIASALQRTSIATSPGPSPIFKVPSVPVTPNPSPRSQPSEADVSIVPSDAKELPTPAVRLIRNMRERETGTVPDQSIPGNSLNILTIQRAALAESTRIAQGNRLLANVKSLFPAGVPERAVLNLNSLVRHDIDLLLMEHANYCQRKYLEQS
jgi:hypothetical protein